MALLLAGAGVVVAVILGGGGYWVLSSQPAGAPITSEAVDISQLTVPDDLLFWRLKPGLFHAPLVTAIAEPPTYFSVSTNKEGLRNPALQAKGERFRILAVGDSTTFGLGVNDDETWPAQLQDRLDARAARIEVLNAGNNGWSSYQGWKYLETEGAGLEPDFVVATFGYNDRAPWYSDYAYAARQSSTAKQVFAEELPKRERLTKEEFAETLKKIHATCQEHSAGLLLLVWPSMGNLQNPGSLHPYSQVILDVGQETGISVIDLSPVLRAAPQPVYVDDIHANANGCRAVAECLADWFREKGVLP